MNAPTTAEDNNEWMFRVLDEERERTAKRPTEPNDARAHLEDDEAAIETSDLDPRPPAFTDEALALWFAEVHATDLRYVAAWGRWLYFDGTCWRFDETLLAFNHARQICRQGAAACNGEDRNNNASAKTGA